MRMIWAGVGAAAVLGLAGSAHAAVTVIGGGMAEACSKAAISGESAAEYEALCTTALESEEILTEGAAELGEDIGRAVADPLLYEAMMEQACRYSLLERDPVDE